MSRGRRGPGRVYLHIGLPKTGTTYLQHIVWGNRDTLRSRGIFLPGFGHREHLWAALDLQQRPRLARRHAKAPGAWQRLVDEANGQQRDVLLTHEFMCGATAEQAAGAVRAFGDAEVHVIVTARPTADVVSAGWQESVKNGSTVGLDDVIDGASAGGAEFSMATWDLHGVLQRWGTHVDPERVHVLVMPRAGEPRARHWEHFAEVMGVSPDGFDAPDETLNPALGIVQIELLRQINTHLKSYSAHDRGVWIRGYLAEGMLAGQERQRGGLPDRHVERFAARDRAARELIESSGFSVRGDLDLLRGDVREAVAAGSRVPDTVTPEELLESAGRLVADIVADVRARTHDVPQRKPGKL